jgi:ketosteroid isomerase-like protein
VAQTASANRDLVRSICAPWEHGDFGSAEWADPEIEYVLVDGPSPGRWTGLAAMGEVFRGVLNAYAEYHVAAEEFRELDDERVLVLHRYTGRGRTSGLEIGQIASKGADLFHVRGGKVTRLVLYWELDRALTDLGLPDMKGRLSSEQHSEPDKTGTDLRDGAGFEVPGPAQL